MKKIELSSEDINMLVEMTSTLFPEYKTIQINSGSCDYCLEHTIKLSTEENPQHNNWVLIHWFEFCVYHLSYKIERLLDNNSSEVNWMNFISANNPVEYLYSEFKQIPKINIKVDSLSKAWDNLRDAWDGKK